MTLYRQLLVLILALFVLMFAGVLIVKVNGTRAFLGDQLASHAQDTATSLGLSMSSYMDEEDTAMLQTMVDAVFDRGYYREITVSRLDGTIVVDRVLDVRIEGIPEWFIELLPLDTPRRSSALMSGWRQAGEVSVRSHPGYAYLELWQTYIRTLIWFGVVSLIIGVLGFVGLRVLLRPLKAVEKQAEAICAKQYPVQEQIPRTRELRSVVQAMNRMTAKVKAMFDEQSETAERLREQAYIDSVTSLGNRAYFQGELHNLLLSKDESGHGFLMLLELENLASFNDEFGYDAGDRLLQQFSAVLEEQAQVYDAPVVARIGGGNFALLLAACPASQAKKQAQLLLERLQQEYCEGRNLGDMTFIGIAGYSAATSPGELLSCADNALRKAQSSGDPRWSFFEEDEQPAAALSRSEWQDYLQRAFAQRTVQFHAQAVMAADGDHTLQHEILARLPYEGGLWTAGKFMPMVRELKLSQTMDEVVLDLLVPRIAGLASATLAVNLAPELLASREYLGRVLERIKPLQKKRSRVVLEFSERDALRNVDNLRWFSERVQELGQGIGIDHFGRSFSGFGYLQSLRPEYVKIDGAYVSGVAHDPDSRFFIGTLCAALHSIDIKVIAESVETDVQRSLLAGLKVDGVQGYAISKPVAFESVFS